MTMFGKKHSEESKNKMSLAKKGKHLKECSKCGFVSENGGQFHWANVSGDYLRDLSDWKTRKNHV